MRDEEQAKKQRGAPLIATILDAALVEIARVGPYDLSIDEVAKHAGVNKTTIYRRWPNPEALAFAAFSHGSTTAPMPDTGSLRSDVIDCVKLMREVCRTPAMLTLARMQLTGELTGKLGEMLTERVECSDCDTLIMFERAFKRGELPPSTDLKLVRDVVLGSVQHQLYFRDSALPDYKLEQIVDMTLAGAGYTAQSGNRHAA
jgi:AcrR family transcriptional regulator